MLGPSLIVGLLVVGQNQNCEPVCNVRGGLPQWKPACGQHCRNCPTAAVDQDGHESQSTRSNYSHSRDVQCEYSVQNNARAADGGNRAARAYRFAYQMTGPLEDTCLTNDIDVVHGSWPDGVTNPDCSRSNCVDASCVCIARCMEICSQHSSCFYADFHPGNNDCRLFTRQARRSGTGAGHTLMTKDPSTCTGRGADTTEGTARPTIATEAPCDTQCPAHQWKSACDRQCQTCPTAAQDDELITQAYRSNYSAPENPITCEYDTHDDMRAADRGDRANRAEVFGYEMTRGQTCLVSDINVELGTWPTRTGTHLQRCMEICSQHPECGMADYNPGNQDCRLYRCSAATTSSGGGHTLMVKRAGSCINAALGGGCTAAPSAAPTGLTASPVVAPTPPPTSVPTTVAPTTVAPTSALPTAMPTPAPSDQPSVDPCGRNTCVRYCTGTCGWSNGMCVTGGITTYQAIQSCEGCPSSVCGWPTVAPTSSSPTQSPNSGRSSESSGDEDAASGEASIAIAIAVIAVLLVAIIAVFVVKNMKGGSSNASSAFDNPMYSSDDVVCASPTYIEPDASATSGYMDVAALPSEVANSGYNDVPPHADADGEDV